MFSEHSSSHIVFEEYLENTQKYGEESDIRSFLCAIILHLQLLFK